MAERHRELEAHIALNTQWMRRAELEGHVSELHDHHAELKLWIVPPELFEKVGYHAAVVRP